jgi:hypothetical protein
LPSIFDIYFTCFQYLTIFGLNFPPSRLLLFGHMKSKNISSDGSIPAEQAEKVFATIEAAIRSIIKILNDPAEDGTGLDCSLADRIGSLPGRREIDAKPPVEVFATWVDDPHDYFTALRAKEQVARGPARSAANESGTPAKPRGEANSCPRFPKAHGLRRVK